MASFKKKTSRHRQSPIRNLSFLGRRHNRQDQEHRRLLDEEESPSTMTPPGCVAIYVGEESQRFLVPTVFLSHPLFSMVLEKASDEFGLEHKKGLRVPCSVDTFREVMNAVEGCKGRFEFGKQLVEELV